MLKTEAVKNFLEAHARSDLADLYNPGIEVQVNVIRGDEADSIEGEYEGVRWAGWTDGLQVWKPFRIPWNAGANARYVDSDISFNLETHALGIGMTGWDWENKRSRWVAFDFDSLVGHKAGLKDSELKDLSDQLASIPYVTIRTSTSGLGLHIYVFLDFEDLEVDNHNEHAALARAILGRLEADSGIELNSKVDICGGNMWVWHRNMGVGGLKEIKKGSRLQQVPPNWKDQLNVVAKRARKHASSGEGDLPKIGLDDEHKRLISWLGSSSYVWWWDQDKGILVTHTWALLKAYSDLGMRGVFKTIATGTLDGQDWNCFMHPLPNGGWVVRRFGQGCTEADTWRSGKYTRCYLNVESSLEEAAATFNGVEQEKGGYVFDTWESLESALRAMGVSGWTRPEAKLSDAGAILRLRKKGGGVVVELPETSVRLDGWIKEKKSIKKVLRIPESVSIPDDEENVRHLISEDGENLDWAIRNENDQWVREPLSHVKCMLKADPNIADNVEAVVGRCVHRAWTCVKRPFEEEYPGGRVWNMKACQFAFEPNWDEEAPWGWWRMIFDHLGSHLDEAVRNSKWCKSAGITKGSEYLICWVAAMLQYPTQPLPYIFFYGPEDSGKSIFHESLALLVTPNGVTSADRALTNQTGFNGEIEDAVLCVVEETDLSAKGMGKMANNRIKEWVTSPRISIRRMHKSPYMVTNTSHWVHCSNHPEACPVMPGDTRIVVCYVNPPDNKVAKKVLLENLKKEGPNFLGYLLRLEIPESDDRLRIPVVTTTHKLQAMSTNADDVTRFCDEKLKRCPGAYLLFGDVYEAYATEVSGSHIVGRNKFSSMMPDWCLSGRLASLGGIVVVANTYWADKEWPGEQGVVYTSEVRDNKVWIIKESKDET